MNIDEELKGFIEYPTDSREFVTTVSTKLFAKHWAKVLEMKVNELQKKATQRGARLQIMRSYMRSADWHHLLRKNIDAADWFDSDGVPK